MKLFITDNDIREIENNATNARHVRLSASEATGYRATTEAERNAVAVAFDFNAPAITVVAVERVNIGDAKSESTIIGFYANDEFPEDNALRQWNIYCSREQHNKLVQEFVETRKAKAPYPVEASEIVKPKKQLLKG